ncbi:protein transport protein sft2 [Entomophthora muscae]|uniref:Protein transport protein sft2 n=3 Tax=Entomophthora muscae TaxID=34485 RepID=A0ACC2TC09_9FUNG|nr:protein transport protein sft2 [Entomophthora muscae]
MSNYSRNASSGNSTWQNFSTRVSDTTSGMFSSFSSTTNRYIPVNTSPFAANSSQSEPEWFELTLMQRWTGFAICAISGMLMLSLSAFKILHPTKFSLSFTFGSLLIFISFGFLKGPKSHFSHVFSRERMPFTLSYFGSMGCCLFFSLIYVSFLLSIVFFIVQLIALIWYFVSYLPGGSAAMARTAASLLPR